MTAHNHRIPVWPLERPAARVGWSEELGVWVVWRHADVSQVLRDERFAASLGGQEGPPSNLQVEPDYTAANRELSQVMRGRLDWVRAELERVIEAACEAVAQSSSFDLQREVVIPCCRDVSLSLAGSTHCGRSDAERLFELAHTVFLSVHADRIRADGATVELANHFDTVIARSRREPNDDLLSALAASAEASRVLSLVIQMFVGLVTSLPLFLGNALYALLGDSEQRQQYMQSPVSSVSELLRYAGPSQWVYRLALKETVIGGHPFHRGDGLALLLAHANRDADVYPDPEKLDLGRKSAPPLSLGKGNHVCLGNPIIQAAAAIVPNRILTHFPDMEVDQDHIVWGGSPTIRGITEFRVRRRV